MSDHANSANQRVLLDIVGKLYPGLSVVHFNASSFNVSKRDYCQHIFNNSKVDIICVTETWFKSELSDFFAQLPGYKLLRHDRAADVSNKKKGGGIAIYYKCHLNLSVVNGSANSLVEYLNVELCDGNAKYLLSCVYNPSRHYNLSGYFSEIESYLVRYDRIILCGDFNVNLLAKDGLSISFLNAVSALDLKIVNNVHPTRFQTGDTPSLLDIFLVSDLSFVKHYHQMSFVSDHDLISCVFDFNPSPSVPPTTTFYRDFKNINYEALYSDLAEIDWRNCWHMSTVDEKLDFIETQLRELYDRHVPLRNLRIRNSSCPWFTDNVLQAIQQRNKLHNVWKRNPSLVNWENFKIARNRSTLVIRDSKRRYFNSKLGTPQTNKNLWRNLKNLKIVAGKKGKPDCGLDCNSLNEFFTKTSAKTMPRQAKPLARSKVLEKKFQFSAICELDIARCLSKVKSNAVGHDGLSIKFLKVILPYILAPLTHLINHCLTTSTFPQSWKLATVVPVAKKPNAQTSSDFRPISILPCLSKICEMIMSEQIMNFVNDNGLLSPLQSGFKRGHSCKTALIKILDDIRIMYDDELIILLCLLDFSKAFDEVIHELLLRKLECLFGFSGSAIRLMASYLHERMQRVKVDNNFSEYRLIRSGVPQGSILGPLLFSLFINDLLELPLNSRIHGYADDIQLYLGRRTGLTEDLCSRMNEDLALVHNWSLENGLVLNVSKSFTIPISKSACDFNELPSLFIGDSTISYVTKAKNLGIIVNSKLTCTDNVNFMIGKVYGALRGLRESAQYTPLEVRLRLAKQLIMPIFMYSNELYCKPDSASNHKMEVAFNWVVRYVFDVKKFESISASVVKFLNCTYKSYAAIFNLVFLHKLIYNKQPAYLYEKIHFLQSSRSNLLLAPRYNFYNSTRYFFVHTIRLWNSLPDNLRKIDSEASFKASLFNHFSRYPVS